MPRLLEATTPEQYAAQLYDLMAGIGKLTGDAETRMIEILEDARAEIQTQLASLDFDSPSRAMLNRAKAGVDQAMANLAQTMGTTIGELQEQGHALGVDLAIKPLGGERGFEVVSAAISLDQLQIMQAFSAELVQDISTQLRKRINAEITSVVVGAKSPLGAARAIGMNLTDANHFSTIAHRARAITVTEVGRAQSLGTQVAQTALQRQIAEAGQPTQVLKRWLNAHLPGARQTHLEAEARYSPDGTIGPIPHNAFFQVGGFKAYYPKDPSLPPSESVHCHCVTITVLDDDEGSKTVAGNAKQLSNAKANYSTAKATASAAGVAKTKPALNKPATKFIEAPYTSAGLSPVKPLKTGGNGYGGKVMAEKLGYDDPTKSGFQWDSELGAWKHPDAPKGKQLPAFDKLKPAEQLAVMKSAGLSTVTKNQIIKHLDIKKPKAKPYPTSKPTAAPPPPPKPTPQPKPAAAPPTQPAAKTGDLPELKASEPGDYIGGQNRPVTAGIDVVHEWAQERVGMDPLIADRALKDRIMKDLGEVIDRDIDASRALDFVDAFPRHYGIPGDPRTPGQRVASMLVKTWAATSGDANPGSLAVQRAIAKKFDLDWPPPGYVKAAEEGVIGRSTLKAIDDADAFYDEWSDVLDSFVDAQYNATQQWLEQQGIDSIPMIRGVQVNDAVRHAVTQAGEDGQVRSMVLNPASSFSTADGTGRVFGNVVYYVEVPRERILGSCLTGFGCFSEFEFVVIGSKIPDKARAFRS